MSKDNIFDFLKNRKESMKKEIMKECKKRNALKDNLEICHKCIAGKMIRFSHHPQLPNNCPRHDELKKQVEYINKIMKNQEKTNIN